MTTSSNMSVSNPMGDVRSQPVAMPKINVAAAGSPAASRDEILTELRSIRDDMQKGFETLNNTLQNLTNLFLKYDASYSEEVMKETGIQPE